MLSAPGFWSSPPGLRSRLLWPLGALYGSVTALRLRRPGVRAQVPVICVGNFVAGGTGKTPFAIAVAERLTRMGERPAFLTRGHGGSLAGPVLVRKDTHQARDVGDEALLLARSAPTIVARARDAGARMAEGSGASVIVMDDGLQNPSLRKDLSFALIDGETAIGNGACLPAGPLRAPLSAQWPLVQALVVMGPQGKAARAVAEQARGRGMSVLGSRLVPEASAAASLEGRAVVAFAGIGRPEKLFASLREIGATIVAKHAFADHHPFTAAELATLAAEAQRAGALLVTTEKDLARIGEAAKPAGLAIAALPVRAQTDDPARLDALIAEALGRRRMTG